MATLAPQIQGVAERLYHSRWQIAYQLRGVPGVVEVNTIGGELKTYEVQLDPRKLQNFNVPLSRVLDSLRENNGNAGGGYLVHYDEQRTVRGEGLIAGTEDIENVVLHTTEDGTPVFVRDVATVQYAPMLRQGAVTRDDEGECVIGVVMLLAGENARVVAGRVKERIEEIQKSLPEGVVIDTFRHVDASEFRPHNSERSVPSVCHT